MTEQEAEALAERLTRIWGVPSQEPLWLSEDESFRFIASVGYEITLTYWSWKERVQLSLETEFDYLELLYQDGQIFRCHTQPSEEVYDASGELLCQFAAQWMDFFRRGCWLSGANIEASAHEKAEWIQGFSREEIQAWNLKI